MAESFPPWWILSPSEQWAMSGSYSGCHNREEVGQVGSGRDQMKLNILQYAVTAPHYYEFLDWNVWLWLHTYASFYF